MRSKLYTVLASAALMAAAVLATNSAMAETKLQVPFSFMVAGKICPAGHYTVMENTIGRSVTLVNDDSSRMFTWFLIPAESGFKSSDVVLKFDVTGETHLLRSVQIGSMTTSRLDKKGATNEYIPAQLVSPQGE